jgi:hypothetical protein
MLRKSTILETCTEEVYAISEDNGNNKEEDKPIKAVPQNLTPVMIMMINTNSSVWSRTLLKVLLHSGSTRIMIYKKCLPRHCKPCKIFNSRKKCRSTEGTHIPVRDLQI